LDNPTSLPTGAASTSHGGGADLDSSSGSLIQTVN